MFLAT